MFQDLVPHHSNVMGHPMTSKAFTDPCLSRLVDLVVYERLARRRKDKRLLAKDPDEQGTSRLRDGATVGASESGLPNPARNMNYVIPIESGLDRTDLKTWAARPFTCRSHGLAPNCPGPGPTTSRATRRALGPRGQSAGASGSRTGDPPLAAASSAARGRP